MSERSRRKAALASAAARAGAGPAPGSSDPAAQAGGGSRAGAGGRWQVWAAAAAVTLSILAAYHACYRVPFLFDDHFAIADNPSIRSANLADAFSPPNVATTAGRPILNLSFALNYRQGGLSVAGYHVVNLAVHILAALTLMGIVRRSLLTPGLAPRFGRAALPIALTAALVWGLHPVLTESVTYISQRAESLMGLFYLLTLACFIRSAEPGGSSGWAVLSVAACLLGTGTKEIIATAPITVLLYDRFILSRSLGTALGRRPWYYPALAGCWIILAVLMAGSQMGTARGIGFGQGLGPVSYLLVEGRVILGYLRLAFWPHALVFDYGRECFLPVGPGLIPYGAAVLALIGGALWLGWRRSAAGYLCFCFFLILAPTSSIVPIALQPMAESRLYLPLAPLVVVVVAAAYAWGGTRALAALGALSIGLGVLTAERNQAYVSDVSLWRDALAKVPVNSRGHYNLGQALGKLPDPASRRESIAEYQEAIRLRPDFAEPYNNLGAALVAQPGRLQEAAKDYRKAIELKPDYADAYNNLGAVLAESGDLTGAVAEFRKSVELDPGSFGAQNNLGKALANLGGHTDEAIEHLQAALAINPDLPAAERTLRQLLLQNGRGDEGIEQAQEAVRQRPGDVQANLDLADAYLSQGRREQALAQYDKAVALTPGDANAPFQIGQRLAKSGDFAGAIPFLEKAARAAPDRSEALNGLGVTLAQSGRIPEALVQFQAAVRVAPKDASAHANLGNALLATGRPADAVVEYQTALRLQPDYDSIRGNLAYAQRAAAAGGSGTTNPAR